MIKDIFLKDISQDWKTDICKHIYDGYTKRIESNLTQKQYAELTGLKLSTVKRIENGKCFNLKLIKKYKKWKNHFTK